MVATSQQKKSQMTEGKIIMKAIVVTDPALQERPG